jgi:hypothetical protein
MPPLRAPCLILHFQTEDCPTGPGTRPDFAASLILVKHSKSNVLYFLIVMAEPEESQMSTLSVGQKSGAPIELILRWFRNWTRESSLFSCEDEVERIAKDVGISASELRRLASLSPESADLLRRRMAALQLDRNEVATVEPRTLRDLQRVCTMCESHRRCARDLARDAAIPAWKDYCPNADTLMALDALPWAARGEW